jgi:hypothetical protein
MRLSRGQGAIRSDGGVAGRRTAGLQHAELEEQLEVRGRELVRRLLQGHLDLLAAREERREDVAGEDGVVRTRAERGRTRPLVTRSGQVRVSRIAYRSPRRRSTPTGCGSSPRSRPRAGRTEGAAAAIARAAGATIGKRQLRSWPAGPPPTWRRSTSKG